MQILMIMLLLNGVLNTFLLIGIAGSIAKFIRVMNDDQIDEDKAKWAKIMQQRKTRQMQEGNPASYADNLAMSPIPVQYERQGGWDGIPKEVTVQNWDGLPTEDE